MLYHHLLRVLVYEYRMVSLEYYLDEMQPYEISIVAKNLAYTDRANKELLRLQMYITAQVNSTKKLKIEDIMKFKWDDEFKNTGTKISTEEAEKLRNRASELAKKIEHTTFVNVDMNETFINKPKE